MRKKFVFLQKLITLTAMKRFLCILSTFITLLSTANAQQSRILGSWNGKLEAGGSSLTLVLHFTVDSLGKTHFFLDSPDQGAEGIPGEIALLDNDSVSFGDNTDARSGLPRQAGNDGDG